LYESWLNEESADYWRHIRSFEFVRLIAETRVESENVSWLTIGDGRLGLDSVRIRKHGFRDVLATDISPYLLRISKTRGIINEFKIENAEKLTFEDESFDYVFCKESLHHFPQPYKALYEALRCARKGLLLIEPNDVHYNGHVRIDRKGVNFRGKIVWLASVLVRKFGYQLSKSGQNMRENFKPSWEASGNFMYPFSKKDFIKAAYGLNMQWIYFKGLNDHYIEGCEFEPANVDESAIFAEIVSVIKEKDKKVQENKAEPDLLMTLFLKNPPDEHLTQKLEKHGWKGMQLQRNPYLTL
jgi:SAM-dependent methyltransferase